MIIPFLISPEDSFNDASKRFYSRKLVLIGRNITGRALALSIQVRAQRKHIIRRALSLSAGQRHIDRLEIESRRLDLVEIFDGAVVGLHG